MIAAALLACGRRYCWCGSAGAVSAAPASPAGVSAAGALAALVVTGALAHPRIVRDAFRLRGRHDPQIARADWHKRLGARTQPFALALTLTGAFIGLGGIGFGVLARAHTGGDRAEA